MTIGQACKIFRDIDTPFYNTQEKGEAIYMVLNMETHSGITKASAMKVIKFLFAQVYEVGKEGQETTHERTEV